MDLENMCVEKAHFKWIYNSIVVQQEPQQTVHHQSGSNLEDGTHAAQELCILSSIDGCHLKEQRPAAVHLLLVIDPEEGFSPLHVELHSFPG
jgi:hypothetical protein